MCKRMYVWARVRVFGYVCVCVFVCVLRSCVGRESDDPWGNVSTVLSMPFVAAMQTEIRSQNGDEEATNAVSTNEEYIFFKKGRPLLSQRPIFL